VAGRSQARAHVRGVSFFNKKTGTLMKYIILSLTLAVCGNAVAENSGKFENFKKVSVHNAEYFYSGTYFSKNGGDFESDFSKCHDYYLKYTKSNSQGYKVSRSLGKTDQNIISEGVKDCLFVNDWKQYKEINGELQELMFGHLYSKAAVSMTAEEKEKSILELEKRKEWYKKHAVGLVD
jgi:hypothetical protein